MAKIIRVIYDIKPQLMSLKCQVYRNIPHSSLELKHEISCLLCDRATKNVNKRVDIGEVPRSYHLLHILCRI